MKKILFLVILLTLPVLSYGQNLKWNVWGDGNGEYISNITYITENINGEIFIATGSVLLHTKSSEETWTVQGVDDGSEPIKTLQTNPNGNIFVSYKDKLYRSDDNGTTWNKVIDDYDDSCFYINKDNSVYWCRNNSGIYFLSDNSKDRILLKQVKYGYTFQAFAVNSKGHIFYNSNIDGMFKSNDSGKTWTQINKGNFISDNYSFYVDKNDRFLVKAKSGNEIFMLNEIRDSLECISNNLPCDSIFCLAEDSEGFIYIAANTGLFKMSADFKQMQQLYSGTSISYVYINPNDEIYILRAWGNAGNTTLLFSNDKGNSWSFFGYTDSPIGKKITVLLCLPDRELIIGTENHGILKSHIRIHYWKQRLLHKEKFNKVWNISLDSNGILYSFVDNEGVYKSEDLGKNWNLIDSEQKNQKINSVIIDSNDNIFIATNTGLFQSLLPQFEWMRNTFFKDNEVSCLYQASGNRVYAGSKGRFYISSDKGVTWTEKSTGLPDSIRINAIVENSKGDIFVGTDSKGIYKMFNSTNEWYQRNLGLGGNNVSSIVVNSNDDLIAATDYGAFLSDTNGELWIFNNKSSGHSYLPKITSVYYTKLLLGWKEGLFGITTNDGINICREIEYNVTYTPGWIDKGGYLEQKYSCGYDARVKFSKNGKYLYTYNIYQYGRDFDCYIRKWETSTGYLLTEKRIRVDCDLVLDPETEDIYYSEILPDKIYFTITKTNLINDSIYYKTEPLATDYRYKSEYALFYHVYLFLSPDGSELITGGHWYHQYYELSRGYIYSEGGRNDFWNNENGKHIVKLNDVFSPSLYPYSSYISDLIFSKDCNYKALNYSYTYYDVNHMSRDEYKGFSVMDKDFNCRFLKNQKGEEIKDIHIYSTDFSWDSKYLVGQMSDSIYFWNTSDCSISNVWKPMSEGKEYGVWDMKFEKNSKYIISDFVRSISDNNYIGSINIWHIKTGKMLYETEFENDSYYTSLDLSPDCRHIAICSDRGKLTLFKPKLLSDTLCPDFIADSTSKRLGNLISFYDISSGEPTNWEWFFGDGTKSALQNPQHLYSKPGKYTVTLISRKDTKSISIEKKEYIQIITSLEADFSAEPLVGTTPFEVQFNDLSKGDIQAWHWDFGDGETNGLQNPKHNYKKNGSFSIKLIVFDGFGADTIIKNDYIYAKLPLKAAFSAEHIYGPSPLSVTFHDESTGDVISWQWDFGDGETSVEQNPIHIYKKDSSYSVRLIVSDGITIDTIIKEDYIHVKSLIDIRQQITQDYNFSIVPNPFAQTTLISFVLEKETKVKLSIYNVLGQEIITLIDGLSYAGKHEVVFDGKALPIGMYYCIINTEGFRKTYPIALIK